MKSWIQVTLCLTLVCLCAFGIGLCCTRRGSVWVCVCLFVCIGFCVVLGSSTDLWHWVGFRGRTRACVKPVVGQRIVTLSAYLIRTRPSGRKINSWAVCCSAFIKELLLEHNTIFTSLFTSYYTPLSLSLTSFLSLWSLSFSLSFSFLSLTVARMKKNCII